MKDLDQVFDGTIDLVTDSGPAVKLSHQRPVKNSVDQVAVNSITGQEPGVKNAAQDQATINTNPVQATTGKDTRSPAYTRPRSHSLRTGRESANNTGASRRVIREFSDLFEEYSLQNIYSLKESLNIFIGKIGNFFHCRQAVIVKIYFFLQIKTRF